MCTERIIYVTCHAFIGDYIIDTNESSQLSQSHWNSLFSLSSPPFKSLQWPWQLIDWDTFIFQMYWINTPNAYFWWLEEYF